MRLEDFGKIALYLKAAYSAQNFLPDEQSVKIWYEMLSDLDFNALKMAVQKYTMTNHFPPTIADLRASAVSVVSDTESWGDGWQKVMKAVRYYGMYREDEALESLDETTRRCVERVGFQKICMSENIDADRANFRMIYEQEQKERDERNLLSDKVKKTIDHMRLGINNQPVIEQKYDFY